MEQRIESGLLDTFKHEGPKVIITDENVAKLYGHTLAARLKCDLLLVPNGEQAKTREVKELVEDQLLEMGFGSDVTLFALGGGAVTDLVGYVAATYCRGVGLGLIPTTLLAMCDAAIGGKNGINVGMKKNALGTVYQPHYLLIDPEVLKTLPDDEFRSGAAEMLKHGLVWDCSFWDFLEEGYGDWKARSPLFLQKCIAWNIDIKNTVIQEDQRYLLNFGHTVGHALEMMSGMRHGDAIAKGMWIEALWSLGWRAGIYDGFTRYGFDLEWPDLRLDQLWKIMQQDKKNKDNKIYAVSLEEIGKARGLKEMLFNELTACLSLIA